MNKYLLLLLLLCAPSAFANNVFSTLPDTLKADEKYVIYSHGLIVEGDNSRPIHPKFGPYEFELIKLALADGHHFNLIAEHRPKNTDIPSYTQKLVQWVNQLIASGVPPANITLIGFSRGGELTAYASSEIRNLGINTILMATCWRDSVQTKSDVVFGGNFLSVFEASDGARTCRQLADRSPQLASFDEIAISTGKEHGAFFIPLEEWVTPVKQWINTKAQTH